MLTLPEDRFPAVAMGSFGCMSPAVPRASMRLISG